MFTREQLEFLHDVLSTPNLAVLKPKWRIAADVADIIVKSLQLNAPPSAPTPPAPPASE
jgi:hypothetical protein